MSENEAKGLLLLGAPSLYGVPDDVASARVRRAWSVLEAAIKVASEKRLRPVFIGPLYAHRNAIEILVPLMRTLRGAHALWVPFAPGGKWPAARDTALAEVLVEAGLLEMARLEERAAFIGLPDNAGIGLSGLWPMSGKRRYMAIQIDAQSQRPEASAARLHVGPLCELGKDGYGLSGLDPVIAPPDGMLDDGKIEAVAIDGQGAWERVVIANAVSVPAADDDASVAASPAAREATDEDERPLGRHGTGESFAESVSLPAGGGKNDSMDELMGTIAEVLNQSDTDDELRGFMRGLVKNLIGEER